MPRLIAAVCIGFLSAYAILSHPPAQPQTTHRLYLPLYVNPAAPCPTNSRKGLAGIPPLTLTVTRGLCAMGVSTAYQWTTMYATAPYPFKPTQAIGTTPDKNWNVFFEGLSCGNSQAEKAMCAATLVAGTDALYVLIGNEPDHIDVGISDGVPPEQFARYWRVISDTLRTANPNVKLVCCGFLWSNTLYFDQLAAAFAAQNNGADIRDSIDVLAFHLYGNVQNTACQPPYVYGRDTACVLANIDARLYDITRTVQAIDADKPLWVSEVALDSSGASSPADYAAFVVPICARLDAAPVDRYYWFLGYRWQPAINASVWAEDYSLSAVGVALSGC